MTYRHKNDISLRKIEQSDLSQLFELKSDWWGTHKTLIINHEDQDRWFRSIPSNELVMIAERNINWSSAIGVAVYTDIDWVSRSLSISGSIFKEFRSPALTRSAFAAGLDFAFEMLNMHRIEAEVLEYHRPAQQLEIDFLGFSVEGRKRKAVYKSGRYYDSLVLGLLREEWEAQPRVLGLGGSCNRDFDHEFVDKLIQRLKS